MYALKFHINPNDFTEEQFDAIVKRAKEFGYTAFDYSETSALDLNSLDSPNWAKLETRDVLNAVASGAKRADMIDASSTTYTPEYDLDQVKGFTQAEAFELMQRCNRKQAEIQEKFDHLKTW